MMERRDIVMDEIQALGKALGKVLAKLLGTESTSPGTADELTDVEHQIQTDLKINLTEFLELPFDGVKPYLKSRGYMPVHLESLSEILLESAIKYDRFNPERAVNLYERTLDIYQLIDETLNTISLDRYQKEAYIQQRISELR